MNAETLIVATKLATIAALIAVTWVGAIALVLAVWP